MLIRQSKNSYIRTTENYGYITNQLTRHDRVYDINGADFLKQITREPKELTDIVNCLSMIYKNVDKNTLHNDFVDFAKDLAEDNFIIIGQTVEELDEKDVDFTYDIDNPKTLIEDFTQKTRTPITENTQDFFLEEVQGRPLISNLQLELSSRCNERCIHCYIPSDKKNHGIDMPFNRFTKLVDEFANMGGIHITLSGGEALLHKDIIDILHYCRKRDLKISVLSNLISLTDAEIKAMKDTNVSLVQVSLYSMNPEIHDYITTVKGSFEKTKNSIERLVKADVPVQISCPLMKANKDCYEEVLKYARSLKIKAQTDYIMMAQADLDTTNLANRLSLKETEKVINDIIDFDLDYATNFEMQKPVDTEIEFDRERFLAQPICGVGYDNCCVTANGDVYPCAGWQDYILGNVYKQSLKEIWENNSQIKELRKITHADFPQCVDCEARQYCAMCLVRNYNESGGDMFKINKHFCDVAFINKRIVEQRYGSKIKELNELFMLETK